VAEQLRERGLAYRCQCSRSELATQGGQHPATCRHRPPAANLPSALRVDVGDRPIRFIDLVQGPQQFQLARDGGDFVIWRRDDLVSYQLAVLLDDLRQGISRVVRVESTCSTPRRARSIWPRCWESRHPTMATCRCWSIEAAPS
jgi:glutamyl-Q tRNA(Asp) synthetase